MAVRRRHPAPVVRRGARLHRHHAGRPIRRQHAQPRPRPRAVEDDPAVRPDAADRDAALLPQGDRPHADLDPGWARRVGPMKPSWHPRCPGWGHPPHPFRGRATTLSCVFNFGCRSDKRPAPNPSDRRPPCTGPTRRAVELRSRDRLPERSAPCCRSPPAHVPHRRGPPEANHRGPSGSRTRPNPAIRRRVVRGSRARPRPPSAPGRRVAVQGHATRTLMHGWPRHRTPGPPPAWPRSKWDAHGRSGPGPRRRRRTPWRRRPRGSGRPPWAR